MKTRTVSMLKKELPGYIEYLGRNGGILLGVRDAGYFAPEYVDVTFGYFENNTL